MAEPKRRKARRAMSSKALSSGFMVNAPRLLIQPRRRLLFVFNFRPIVSADGFGEPARAQPHKPDETGEKRRAAEARKIREEVAELPRRAVSRQSQPVYGAAR